MKREQLEKANKINSEIEKLRELDAVLLQATSGRHQLASIDIDCYNDKAVLKNCDIPPIILAKFRQVIADEVLRLDAEFEAL